MNEYYSCIYVGCSIDVQEATTFTHCSFVRVCCGFRRKTLNCRQSQQRKISLWNRLARCFAAFGRMEERVRKRKWNCITMPMRRYIAGATPAKWLLRPVFHEHQTIRSSLKIIKWANIMYLFIFFCCSKCLPHAVVIRNRWRCCSDQSNCTHFFYCIFFFCFCSSVSSYLHT